MNSQILRISRQDVQDICTETFADDTMSDEDYAIAKAVEKRVLVRVAQWLDFFDGEGKRRAEYVRSIIGDPSKA